MADPAVAKKYDDNGLHPATLSRADYLAFLEQQFGVLGARCIAGNIRADE